MRYMIVLLALLAIIGSACTAENNPERESAAAPEAEAEATSGPAPQQAAEPPEESTALPEAAATDPPPPVAPRETAVSAAELLPVVGPAPAWNNETWINTEGALPLESLRGKVVLLEFWTFG